MSQPGADSSPRPILACMARPGFVSIGRWLRDFRVIQRYWLQWGLALLFLLLAAAATLAVPLAFRRIVDAGIGSPEINARFLELLALAVVLGGVTAARFYLMSWLGERVVADIRTRVFGNVLRQRPAYFETLRPGEVLSRLTADTTLIQTLVGTSISVALRSAVMFSGGLLMMLATSAWLAGVMLALLLLVVLPMWALGRRVRRMSRSSQDKVADTSALAGEVLGAMTTVQAFVREPYELKRFTGAVESAFREARSRIRLRSTLTATAIILAFSVMVFVLWMGAREVAAGHMSAGELAQFVMYAVLIAGSIGALSEVWGDVQRAAGATERLVELMLAEPDMAGPVDTVQSALPIARGSAADAPQFVADARSSGIHFHEVCFSYPSRRSTRALDGLTFDVPAGGRFALVGASGAGKTTVFSLLLRFYDVDSGSIRVLGRALGAWPLNELRQMIGVVPQDPVIFAASAMDNIRYGRLDASDAEVFAAARSAHIHDVIAALPDGYASFLGERGVRLSGGQRQRISIARAILKNPPVLLLDEATSALDAESEREVQHALDEVLPGRTSLTIAHRLATVLRADCILVMDQGRIVEAGRHDELIRQNGLYARLARLQFSALEGASRES
jgi:ATP-binding cassette subfamily B protein